MFGLVVNTLSLAVKFMSLKSNKITIDIRAKLKVDQDSLEALMDKYLKDSEALPYEKYKLIIGALRTHYLPLIYEYEGASPEKLRQSLIDINRAWQIHFQYLQQRLGIDLTEETPPSAPSTPTPIPVPIAFPMNYEPQQYVKPQPQRKPEPQIKPQAISEEKGEYVHLFD